MPEEILYRAMVPGEASAVSKLILCSFSEFISSEYTAEGIAEFEKFVAPEALKRRTADNDFVRVAECGHDLVGMIEIRDNNHVALLFVDKAYQRHGVAKGLLKVALADARISGSEILRVTVNSSRYGVVAYEKLGFRQTGPERTVNGIAFIPMAMQLHNEGG
jgi:GNAT superfamily N-acetyltransferase